MKSTAARDAASPDDYADAALGKVMRALAKEDAGEEPSIDTSVDASADASYDYGDDNAGYGGGGGGAAAAAGRSREGGGAAANRESGGGGGGGGGGGIVRNHSFEDWISPTSSPAKRNAAEEDRFSDDSSGSPTENFFSRATAGTASSRDHQQQHQPTSSSYSREPDPHKTVEWQRCDSREAYARADDARDAAAAAAADARYGGGGDRKAGGISRSDTADDDQYKSWRPTTVELYELHSVYP
jgi:hypothetical protein